MSWFKLGRATFLGLLGVVVSAACGGRNELPTESNAWGSGEQLGGEPNVGGSTAAGSGTGGAGGNGGSVPLGGSLGTAGTSVAGSSPTGGAGACPLGSSFCKGTTLVQCDANGYRIMACAPGQTCADTPAGPRCVKQLCTPGQLQCNAAGTRVQVCTEDGASIIDAQDCAAQGQHCKGGTCQGMACQPNQRFCENGAVRLCNASGSASVIVTACGKGQYCDPQSLACKDGVCSANQPTCNGSVATTCNADGSGYLMGGVDCGAQIDRACVQGACLCRLSSADCDGQAKNGCEVNTSTDPNNCGGCGFACSSANMATRTCSGTCDGTCKVGFQDCNGDKLKDGCETSLSNDAKNCGGCAVVCSNNHVQPTCAGSVCAGACAANFNDCNGNKQTDGCESDSRTDVKNCGACGLACSTNHVKAATCSAGACSSECSAGYGDCNTNKQSDGCETSLLTDPKNCGACGAACSAGSGCVQGKCQALYSFTGVAQNVSIDKLVGWTQCYSDTYGTVGVSLAKVQQACTGSLLMMACRPKGTTTLQLAAYAPRVDVLFDTGTGNVPHNANGVGWYFSGMASWGFAPQGDVIERFSCDTQDSTLGNGGVDGDKRLCWHTNAGNLDGGWRCGRNDELNVSTSFERLLFTAQ